MSVQTSSGRPEQLPPRVRAHIARAQRAGLTTITDHADTGYAVRLCKPRVLRALTAADEFANAEAIWIIGDRRQIRRVEWHTLAGVLRIRASDIGAAIAAVAL